MTTWGWVSAGWVSAGWALIDADLRLPTGRCEGSSACRPPAGTDASAVFVHHPGRSPCPWRQMEPAMDAPLVPEILLRHGQFVQSLARSLLRDAHQAEDVAQEAWARFVERGPREEGSSRGW